jgi:hypothetical protein
MFYAYNPPNKTPPYPRCGKGEICGALAPHQPKNGKLICTKKAGHLRGDLEVCSAHDGSGHELAQWFEIDTPRGDVYYWSSLGIKCTPFPIPSNAGAAATTSDQEQTEWDLLPDATPADYALMKEGKLLTREQLNARR